MNWLILRTRPHHELKVETAVQQIGIQAYCPEIVTRRRHHVDRRRILTLRRAIYPGYCFASAHFEIEQIVTTKLTACWLKDGSGLAHISDRLMDMIEAGERMGIAIEEAIEALRCAPVIKRLMKRAPYSKDVRSVLGRAA